MAGSLVDAQANAVLDRLLGLVAISPPATYHAALYTVAPTGTGGGTEVGSGVGYARVAITNNLTNFPAAVGRAKSNGVAITYGVPSGAWGDIIGMALMSASTGGTMWFYARLDNQRSPQAGDPAPSYGVGELLFTLPNAA